MPWNFDLPAEESVHIGLTFFGLGVALLSTYVNAIRIEVSC
uniref:Uncharacterized protein n=1 Tax=Arundo donax TaxID=35708 RepID=A0A0A9EXV5_ARUDO